MGRSPFSFGNDPRRRRCPAASANCFRSPAQPRGSRRDRRPGASSQSASRRMVAPFSWRCALPRWRRCNVYFGRGVAFFQPADDVRRAARSIRARTNARHSTVVAGGFLLCCKALAFQYQPRARDMSYSEGKSDKNVSRETFLSGWGRKPYKRSYAAQILDFWDCAENCRGRQIMGRPESGDLPIKQR